MPMLKGPAVTLAGLCVVTLAFLLGACQSMPQDTHTRSTEPIATDTVRIATMPQLDLAAPAHTETATFALG